MHLAAGSEDGLSEIHLSQLLLHLLERGIEECWVNYHTLDVPCVHTQTQRLGHDGATLEQ